MSLREQSYCSHMHYLNAELQFLYFLGIQRRETGGMYCFNVPTVILSLPPIPRPLNANNDSKAHPLFESEPNTTTEEEANNATMMVTI